MLGIFFKKQMIALHNVTFIFVCAAV